MADLPELPEQNRPIEAANFSKACALLPPEVSWGDRLTPGIVLAIRAELRAALALHEARFRFLHSINEDAEGYEWGVCRVKMVGGSPVSVLWGVSDHSDIDAAMRAATKA